MSIRKQVKDKLDLLESKGMSEVVKEAWLVGVINILKANNLNIDVEEDFKLFLGVIAKQDDPKDREIALSLLKEMPKVLKEPAVLKA